MGKLTAPVAFDVVNSDGAQGPGGLGLCARQPLHPSFYVSGDAREVELLLWRGGKKVETIVAGPLEAAHPATAATDDEDAAGAVDVHFNCEASFPLTFRPMSGTWAVFITGRTPSMPMTLVAWRKGTRVDLAWAPRPLPESLPLGPERELSRHYPLSGAEQRHTDLVGVWLPERVEGFFRHAPRTLFVSVGPDVEADADGKPLKLVAGEPLLVREWGKTRSSVNRLDGARVEVETRLLIELPTPATLPANLTAPPAAKTVRDALYSAGENEQAFVDRYNKLEEDLNACVGEWMSKHDPTWGKSYDLVYSNGETVSDRKFKQADGACGLAKVEAAGKKLVSDVNASLKKNLAAYRKALVERFSH